MKTDYCFPNRVAEIAILENAIAAEKNCANACYYLGNLYYDKKQYAQAIELWEKAIRLKKDFAMAYRNLSIAYFNKTKDKAAALSAITKEYEIEPIPVSC